MTLQQLKRKLAKLDELGVDEAGKAMEILARLRQAASEGHQAWIDAHEMLWLFTVEDYAKAHAVFVRRRDRLEGLDEGPDALQRARFYAFGGQAAGKLALDARVDVLPWAERAAALASDPAIGWEEQAYILRWACEGFRGLDGWALAIPIARRLYELGKTHGDDLAIASGLVHLAAGLAELTEDGAPDPELRACILGERDTLRRMIDEGSVPFAPELLAQIENVFGAI